MLWAFQWHVAWICSIICIQLIPIFWSHLWTDVRTQASAEPLPFKQQLYWAPCLPTETIKCLLVTLYHMLTMLSFFLTSSNRDLMVVCWQEQQDCHATFITTVGLDQAHFNAHLSYHCKALLCWGYIDFNKVNALQVTVTSHSQVTVTIMWVNNPSFLGHLTQNWVCIWFNRLIQIPSVMSGNDHPTHTLHSTTGIACALLTSSFFCYH